MPPSFSVSLPLCSSAVSSYSLRCSPSLFLSRSLSPFFLPRCAQCLGSLTLAPRKSYGRNYHTAGIIIRVYASVSLCRYDYPAFSFSLFLFLFPNFFSFSFSSLVPRLALYASFRARVQPFSCVFFFFFFFLPLPFFPSSSSSSSSPRVGLE